MIKEKLEGLKKSIADKLSTAILVAVIGGTFSILSIHYKGYLDYRVQQQSFSFMKEKLILEDSLARIKEIKQNRVQVQDALMRPIKVLEVMDELLHQTNAMYAHVLLIHNGV